jgi:hypothetical protein
MNPKSWFGGNTKYSKLHCASIVFWSKGTCGDRGTYMWKYKRNLKKYLTTQCNLFWHVHHRFLGMMNFQCPMFVILYLLLRQLINLLSKYWMQGWTQFGLACAWTSFQVWGVNARFNIIWFDMCINVFSSIYY